MLRLTVQAARMIREVIARSTLPEGAGLRIAQREDHRALAMSLVEAPGPDDTVVVAGPTEGPVAVFLAPVAAARVRDQTLDARSDERCSAFYLRD